MKSDMKATIGIENFACGPSGQRTTSPGGAIGMGAPATCWGEGRGHTTGVRGGDRILDSVFEEWEREHHQA